MKKYSLVPLICLFLGLSIAHSQDLTFSNLFDGNTKVTFFGIDYTHARLIGSTGFVDPNEIQEKHLPAINMLFSQEEEKFSLKPILKVKNYETSINHHLELNKKVKVSEIITDSEYKIDESKIGEYIAEYDLGDKSGLGITYILESFNKIEEKGYAYFVLFDIKTKKVIKSARLEGEARGFGFRNHWAGVFTFIKNERLNKLVSLWRKEEKIKK